MKRKTYDSKLDNYKIVYDHFTKSHSKNKTFIIVHGKNEYSDRYHNLAKSLLKEGYNSYIINHRGHGHTGLLNNDMGYFKGDVKKIFLSDINSIIKIARKENPKNKIILLGHSMGSYITRYYISVKHDVDAYICIGTTHPGKILIKFMKILAFLISKVRGKKESKFLNKILASKTDGKFAPNKKGAWLTRDEKIVKEFLNSPLSKSDFKSKTIYDFTWLLDKIIKNETIKSIDKKLPILLLAGNKDISSENGKLVKKFYQKLKKENLNVKMILYQDMRHEILQEIDKEKVITDITTFAKNI